jgi:hypothetical protein
VGIFLTLVEVGLRLSWDSYTVGAIIFCVQLFIIGVLMLVVTAYLLHLMKKIFGDEFVDEENQLKWSLGVFLSTYFIRTVLKTLTITLNNTFVNMKDSEPIIVEGMIVCCQLMYDVLPALLIFNQHHRTFKDEDR